MFDLVIHGGEVIDGARSPRFRADLGIVDGRIREVGALDLAVGQRSIDARGKVVAPGFIDVHNHSDGWLLRKTNLVPKTLQGFTTEVLMADGISYAPVSEHTAREWLFYLRALDGLRMSDYTGWRSLADYMSLLEGRTAQNSMFHIPYANLRAMACGWGRGAVDDFQQREILDEVRRGMADGAVGLSTGLDYIAQCFSTTDEIAAACKPVAESGGLYVTHVRYKAGLLPALQEAVEIGRRSGVKVHVSHLKAVARESADQVLNFIDRVARQEVDFTFDVYPYQPGSTMLNYLMPYDAWEDGPIAAPARLARDELRAKFARGVRLHRLPTDRMRIAWTAGKDSPCRAGQRLTDYVAETGKPLEEALVDLLLEERLAVLLVFDEGDDALARPFLAHDLCIMGTDGIYFEDGVVHPRVYGSVGRLLGRCVRDWRLFSLEEAVYKITNFPAQRFGVPERGVVREGMVADLVVFDANIIADRATYDDPHQATIGVEHVLVGGTPIVTNGKAIQEFNGRAPGRFLRAALAR